MNISEIMTGSVEMAAPTDTLLNAAERMGRLNCGVLPVGENGKIIGIVTDRDIVVRAVAKGLRPEQTSVRAVMSDDVKCCYADESVETLVQDMRKLQVKRMPVLDRDERVVGIVSLGDIAIENHSGDLALEALVAIALPDGYGEAVHAHI